MRELGQNSEFTTATPNYTSGCPAPARPHPGTAGAPPPATGRRGRHAHRSPRAVGLGADFFDERLTRHGTRDTAHAHAAFFLLFLLYTTARGGAPHTCDRQIWPWGRETRGGGSQRPAPTSHSPDDHALATERRKVLAASAAAGGHWRWAKSSSATRCFTSPGATLHSRCASAVPRSPPAAFVAA